MLVIDEEKTFREKGYRSTDLKPKSHKEVWRVCDECEFGRWIEFRYYRDLCIACSNQTEERSKKIGDANRRRVISEDTRIKLRARKNGMCGREHTPETRKLMRENHADVSLENHPNWRGGTSFEPYCARFNEEFKEIVRERFGRVCFMCQNTEEENGRKLSVHHVNYDKECMCSGVECEFVPLCKKCHNKTNYSRELWERLIINVLYYDGWI